MVECGCGLVREARIRRWDGKFGFVGWLLDSNFDTFQAMPNQPGARKRRLACDTVYQWTAGVETGTTKRPLVLFGGNGTGKTHLASAAANRLRLAGIPCAFGNVPEVLDWLRSTFRPNTGEDFDSNFEDLKNAPALVLDDLGAQSSTPWADEKLYELVNYRTLRELPLLVTTNLPSESLERRLASRLAGGYVDCGNFDFRQVAR